MAFSFGVPPETCGTVGRWSCKHNDMAIPRVKWRFRSNPPSDATCSENGIVSNYYPFRDADANRGLMNECRQLVTRKDVGMAATGFLADLILRR
jgi:hypothetical protein